QPGGVRPGADRADPAGDRRDRLPLPARGRRGAAPTGARDHPRLRRGSGRLMVSRRLFRDDGPGRSLPGRVLYHAARWVPLLVVAALTYLVFPFPTRLAAPSLRVGQIAEETVRAPFYFVVPKSDAERALEGEARALSARPVYRFDAGAYDSTLEQLDSLFAALDVAAQDSPEEVQAVAARHGARLGPAGAEYLLDPKR